MTSHVELVPLGEPAAPAVLVRGTVGETSYSYKVVALNARGHSMASDATAISTGNATLSGSNYNQITPPVVTGASGFDIYRTAGGGTQGKIGSVKGRAPFKDTGKVGDSATAPSRNTTGLWLYYTAWDTDANTPMAEDLANHTISLSADGQDGATMANNGDEDAHVEIGNGEYAIQCGAAEVNANTLELSGASSTENVVIVPTRVKL